MGAAHVVRRSRYNESLHLLGNTGAHAQPQWIPMETNRGYSVPLRSMTVAGVPVDAPRAVALPLMRATGVKARDRS